MPVLFKLLMLTLRQYTFKNQSNTVAKERQDGAVAERQPKATPRGSRPGLCPCSCAGPW